jgi:hypothetical protein
VDRWRVTFEGKDTPKGGMWENSSKIVPPDMRASIESVNSRNQEALFASRERVRFKPRDPAQAENGKKLVQHIDDFFHSPEINLRGRMTRSCLDALVDCTVICDTFWRREKHKRRRRVRITTDILAQFAGPNTTPATEVGNPEEYPNVLINGKHYRFGDLATLEQEVITHNHFDFRFVQVPDFFMYPATARTIEEATVAGYDFWQTENEIRVEANNGGYDPAAVRWLFEDKDGKRPVPDDNSPVTSNANGGIRDFRADGVTEENEGDSRGFARYKMQKFWARVRDANNDNMFEDFLIIRESSTGKILFMQSEPYDNLKRSMRQIDIDPRIGGGFYGYSLVEKCMDTHLELQSIARLGIDLAVLAATILIPVDPTVRRTPGDIRFRPGPQYWREDTQGTLRQPVSFPLVQNQYLPERAQLTQYLEKVTGASEILTGATPQGGTATAANIQVASSGVRSKPMLLNILEFLTWLYNQYRDYSLQFMEETPGGSFAISLGPGRGFEDVSLEVMGCEGTISAYCDAIDPDVALRLQAAEKTLTLLMQSPFVTGDMARQWTVLSDYIKETDRSFNPIPRIGTYEEAQKLQIQQANAEKASQQSQWNLPQVPPNISLEYLAVLMSQNPDKAQSILPILRELNLAEDAGEMEIANNKMAADIVRDGVKPPAPKPTVPIQANGNSPRTNRPGGQRGKR